MGEFKYYRFFCVVLTAWVNADRRLTIDLGRVFSEVAIGKFFDYLELGRLYYLIFLIYSRMTVVNGLFDSLLELVFHLRRIWWDQFIKRRKCCNEKKKHFYQLTYLPAYCIILFLLEENNIQVTQNELLPSKHQNVIPFLTRACINL